MNTEPDFQNIGKKMPYKVPDGFFDRITEKTLEKAHDRENQRRRKVVLWRSLSVAASLITVVLAGILFFPAVPEKTSGPVVQNVPAEIKKKNVSQEISTPVKSSLKADIKPAQAPVEKPDSSAAESEAIDDVLASLPDEELLGWAVTIKNDMFIEETENSLP